jgi:hypothetical protein
LRLCTDPTGLSITKQSFGFTREIRGTHIHASQDRYPYSGIAGLSTCDKGAQGFSGTPSFLESLLSGGHLQSSGFSLWMNPVTLFGEILFGAVDSSKYSGSLYLFDLVDPTSWYSIYLTGISSSGNVSTCHIPKVQMVFDTSVSGIVLPRSVQTSIITLFNGSVDENSILLVPCSTKTNNYDIEFTLAEGIVISIPVSAFVGAPAQADGMCQSTFSFTDETSYVFGTSFLQYVYLVLNTQSSQGAIAQATFTNIESSITIMTPVDPLPGAIIFISGGSTTSNSAVTSSAANATVSLTTAVVLATSGSAQVVTETVLTTISGGVISEVVTAAVSSTSNATRLTHLDVVVMSPSTSASATSASISTNLLATARTLDGDVASAALQTTTSTTTPTTAPGTDATSTSISRTNAGLIASTINADVSTSSTNTVAMPDSNKFTTAVTPGTSMTSTTSGPGRNTNRFDVPVTSAVPTQTQPQGHMSWPPISIDINIQNIIIFTTTHRYAPNNWADVVTVTSTATVVTTVPCSTNTASIQTITAKVLQILIVPSPTPYVDPDCGCSKTDIVYVDEQSLTKTIYVQPATPVLGPTQQANAIPTQPACDCTECYYTVKKTKTITATYTAAPASTSITLGPTFIGAGTKSSTPVRVSFVVGLVLAVALQW